MAYLKESEIISIIMDYINDPQDNFAILIDGEWGSGKTFFVEKKISPLINEITVNGKIKRKAIYVSLFGVNSQQMIDELIYSKILELDMGKAARILPYIKKAMRLVSDDIGLRITEILNKLYKKLVFLETIVFIFDDLERCSMPINEVIGYINVLVEHAKFKLIIIANQKEIGKMRLYQNLEEKYLVAFQYSDYQSNESKKVSKDEGQSSLSIKEIKTRVEDLFKEDELYFQTKEKLIGKTIYYNPELSEIIPIMINSFDMESIMEFMKVNTLEIINFLESNHHMNLRTLQYVFQFLRKIYKLHAFDNFDENWRKVVYKKILFAVLHSSVMFRRGEKPHQWDMNAEYGYISGSEEVFDNYESFRFIDDYVYTSSFSPERINKVLIDYYNEKKNSDNSYDAVNDLNNFWMMEDEEVEGLLQLLYDKFFEGGYRSTKYSWIIRTLVTIESYGFKTRVDEIVEQMIVNIRSENNYVNIDSRIQELAWELKDEHYYRFIGYMEQLTKAAEANSKSTKISTLNSLLEMEKGWGTSIYEYYDKNKGEILIQKRFIADIDMEMLIDKLDKASTREFTDFRGSVLEIYRFENIHEYFLADRPNLERLFKHFENMKYNQKTKDMNRIFFIHNLEGILARL